MLCRFGLKQSRESLEKLRHGAFVVWSFVWFCLFVIASFTTIDGRRHTVMRYTGTNTKPPPKLIAGSLSLSLSLSLRTWYSFSFLARTELVVGCGGRCLAYIGYQPVWLAGFLVLQARHHIFSHQAPLSTLSCQHRLNRHRCDCAWLAR